MWTCPKCQRQFKNTNQDHSCILVDPELHFIDKDPGVKEIFNAILEAVRGFGDTRMSSVKNAILFATSSNFLAVKPKKNWLDIEFILPYEAKQFPVNKTVKISKTMWAHFVRIESESEVDMELIGWLREAYTACK